MADLLRFLENLYDEVSPREFYRDVFPEGELERKGVYEQGLYTGVIVEITPEKKEKGGVKVLRHTVTDDLDKIDEVTAKDNFCIMSPISYAGKSRKSENARYMYAMAIDVDGIESEKNFNFLLAQIRNNEKWRAFIWGIPTPTYMVSSGTGIHLYYVFERPVPLYKNIVKELEKLKRRITWQTWTQGATVLGDSVQYESLYQGFRMPGTVTKSRKARAAAFKVGEKVTIEYLNHFVPEDFTADIRQYKSKLSLKDAARKYPEWYQKRIVEEKKKGTWMCKKDLYDWWIRRVRQSGRQGHRYWCMMALAAYAKKCGVDYETLFLDAMELRVWLDSIGDGTDPFTVDDVMHALEAYNDSYITYPIDTISYRTDISIEKNKRNYRKQEAHLYLARRRKEDLKAIGESVQEGRPTAEQTVREWQESHPNGRKVDCIKETGLSKPTVYKWWKEQ